MSKYNKEFFSEINRTVYYTNKYELIPINYKNSTKGGTENKNICGDIKHPTKKKITFNQIANVLGKKAIHSLLFRFALNNEKIDEKNNGKDIGKYIDYLNEKYKEDLNKEKIIELFSAD